MRKPEYTDSDRKALIELAHMKGMSDGEIFRHIVIGVLGNEKRTQIVIQWGELMGMKATQALRIARNAGVVLTGRRPKKRD
jgi:hypothetical protein